MVVVGGCVLRVRVRGAYRRVELLKQILREEVEQRVSVAHRWRIGAAPYKTPLATDASCEGQ